MLFFCCCVSARVACCKLVEDRDVLEPLKLLSACNGSRVGERMSTNDCSGVAVISTLLLLECEVRSELKLKEEGGSAIRGTSVVEEVDGRAEVVGPLRQASDTSSTAVEETIWLLYLTTLQDQQGNSIKLAIFVEVNTKYAHLSLFHNMTLELA